MKAVIIKSQDGKILVEQIQKPKPKPGEFLVKNEGSPINPADINFIERSHKELLKNKEYVVLGFEGVGTVVEIGDDSLKDYLNKKVVTIPDVLKNILT